MKNRIFVSLALISSAFLFTACPGSKSTIANNGQLVGATYGAKQNPARPYGMVHIPDGYFHIGPSDEDVNYAFNARNRTVSIKGFWMDATEITNSEYKQFVFWVRDSIAGTILDLKDSKTGNLDPKKIATIWKQPNVNESLSQMMMQPQDRINGRMEIDPKKLIYAEEYLDYRAAAYGGKDQPRSEFIVKNQVPVYPDTLVWVRYSTYSYNDPMSKRYFDHPAFANYPVVGVTWKQASAFCTWRSRFLNTYLESKNYATESSFRLPTEAEWEYAARANRSQSMYPWGNYYLRNRKGCLMANFKPGRGNYPEDGGYYTVRADAYWPNDFGLYNMAGNVAEWTSSLYYEGGYNFADDLNPDIRYNAKEGDPKRMHRKVIRGGSWKDVGYFLQNGTRAYEYQDTAKAYIGFRCVVDLPPMMYRR